MKKIILLVDAGINLLLGILLIAFKPRVITFLGVPNVQNSFYANILGAILFGIGIALLIECCRKREGMVGLGLGGAISINLSGGIVLAYLLLNKDFDLPLHGKILLWIIVLILVLISSLEWIIYNKNNK